MGTRKLATSNVSVSFHNIRYEVKQKVDNKICGKEEMKDILSNISGILPAGLNAIMGPTGSGKTSLLDLLAQRKDPSGLREGIILFDGKPPPQNIRLMSGYVVQDDIVMGTLTVRENLAFSANLRLCPKKNTCELKSSKIDRVIKQLGLEACENTLVGTDFARGVSGGERKRVNIGMEMILDPAVLFLDEPTTGLDAHTANSIVLLLNRLAQEGRNIIMSIHQPRYSIFQLFNRLILLNKGEMVYSGDASNSANYFQSIGFNCPEFHNPADFFLDVLGGNVKPTLLVPKEIAQSSQIPDSEVVIQVEDRQPTANDDDDNLLDDEEDDKEEGYHNNNRYLATSYQQSLLSKHHNMELEKVREDLMNSSDGERSWLKSKLSSNTDYATGFLTQMKEVGRRTILNRIRNPMGSYVQLINAALFAVIIGAIYYQSDDSFTSGLQNRAGCFFFLILSQVMSNLSALEAFIQNREFFRHESASGYYRTSVYFISQVFADLIPNRVIPNLLSSLIIYFMIGLQQTVAKFLIFFLGLVLTTISAVSVGFAVSASCRVFLVANALVSIPYILMMLFGGFLVNLGSMLNWLAWLKYISIFRYGINVLTVNEMSGMIFIDNSSYPGYNPHSSTPCISNITHHPIPKCVTGEEYMEAQGIEYGTWGLWQNVLALGLMSFFFLFLSYVQLRRIKKFK